MKTIKMSATPRKCPNAVGPSTSAVLAVPGPMAEPAPSTSGMTTLQWFTLDEQNNAKDRTFVDRMNLMNDSQIVEGRVVYPAFKIGVMKTVKVEYIFKDGQINILFEKAPSAGSKDAPITLRLTLYQWQTLWENDNLFQETFKAVEGKNSRNVEEIWGLVHEEDKKRKDFRNLPNNWVQYRFDMVDDIRITLRWNYKIKNCTIDIRKGEEVSIDGKGLFWKGSLEGICLAARSYDFFCRYLTPKIRNAIRMWTDMHRSGDHLWHSLFSTYKPLPSGSLMMKAYSFASFRPVEDSDDELEKARGVGEQETDTDSQALEDFFSQAFDDNI